MGERVLETAVIDAGDHRLHSLDRALHTTQLPSDDGVPTLLVAVGLPVLDELVPCLELLLAMLQELERIMPSRRWCLKAKMRAARSFSSYFG